MFSKTNSPPDGRKYRLALICLLCLLTGFGLGALNPAFAKLYSEFIAAILGVLVVYCGGNVTNKWALGKPGGVQMGGGLQEGPPPPAPGSEI